MSTTINFDTENFGKLFLRFFVGIYFVIVGVHFFVGGHSTLVLLGKMFKMLGISFSPMFFGVVIACVHIVCGMTMLIGFWFRMSCFFLGTITFLEAILAIYTHGSVFGRILPTITLSMVIYGMMLIGGGRFSAEKK